MPKKIHISRVSRPFVFDIETSVLQDTDAMWDRMSGQKRKRARFVKRVNKGFFDANPNYTEPPFDWASLMQRMR